MHLAINATEVGRRRGGNESYLLGLLQGLKLLTPLPEITLLLSSAGMAALQGAIPNRFVHISVGDYRRLFFHLWQQTSVLRWLRPDWYLSTFFLPPLTPCKAAVLIHDLSFRAHPEYYPAPIAFYMRILTDLAIRRAERVVALSKFTQQELVRFHPAAVGKTVVVYPGVEESFHSKERPEDRGVLRRYGLSAGYILAIGNIHPRKNLIHLLDAYLLLRQQREDMPAMVWVGLPRWGSGGLLERARSAGVILTGFVAQENLPAFYRQAVMLVYPSLYEGFGLPPLEAMACGTPVVTSDSTSLPEVVGEAALLVDVTSVGAVASAMAQMLDDDSLREHLRQAGLERAKRFTWKQTAQCLLSSLDR